MTNQISCFFIHYSCIKPAKKEADPASRIASFFIMFHLHPLVPASRKCRIKHADAFIRTVFAGSLVVTFHIFFLFFLWSDVDLSIADFPADPIHLAIHLCRKLLEFFPAEQISTGRAGIRSVLFHVFDREHLRCSAYFRIHGIDQIHIIQHDALQFVRIFHPLFCSHFSRHDRSGIRVSGS